MLHTRLPRILPFHPLIGIRERSGFELIKFKFPYPALPLQASNGIHDPRYAALLRMCILDRQRNSGKKVLNLSTRYAVGYLSDNDPPEEVGAKCRVDGILCIEPLVHGRVLQS